VAGQMTNASSVMICLSCDLSNHKERYSTHTYYTVVIYCIFTNVLYVNDGYAGIPLCLHVTNALAIWSIFLVWGLMDCVLPKNSTMCTAMWTNWGVG